MTARNFAGPKPFPAQMNTCQCPMADLPQHLEITPSTYLVLTTRGMNVDVEGLPVLVDTPAAYIGVIGSQRRWAMAKKDHGRTGRTAEKLDRVRSPIGLELHAETPEEIAVSILAEIIMLRQGGDGSVMSQAKIWPGNRR